MSKRKHCLKDVFWLRITLLDDPAFPPGAPWRMAPQVFERLQGAGLVEKQIGSGGGERAVGTDLAREQIAGIRERRGAEPFTIQASDYGDRINFAMPAGTDMIIACVDTEQHVPAWIGHPHQLTVETAARLMNWNKAESLTVMPYRNADKIRVGRGALEQEGAP